MYNSFYLIGHVVLVEVENKNILRVLHIEDIITCVSWQHDKTTLANTDNSDQKNVDWDTVVIFSSRPSR